MGKKRKQMYGLKRSQRENGQKENRKEMNKRRAGLERKKKKKEIGPEERK